MTKQRIYYFDWLRVLATISVVVLHAAAPLLYEYGKIPANDWWTGHIFDSVTRWCVPIFFMMSGALMLNPGKQESAGVFFKKRSAKVLIPFIAWSCFYILVKMKMDDMEKNPEAAFKAILSDNVYYHLWFLYVIIGLYAITPILKVYIANASRRNIELFLVLWFVCTSVFSLIAKFYQVKMGFEAFPASGYIGYFVLGYYLFKYSFNRLSKWGIYLIGVAGLCITVFATPEMTEKNNGTFDGFFYHYLNVSVVFMSAAFFLFFKELQERINPAGSYRVLKPFNQASMGIYLVHPFVFLVLKKYFELDAFSFTPIVGIPFMALLTIAISFVITRVLQMIPFVRNVVPN
ncbi:acyltransferase family protein [Bacillus sp. FJAT-42376]|uniref:acyltransferase n=1 Tax=Bacillus sp. FJAT-42376 TaxID=2014076 RepID=UPI0013DDF20B|nr:acyltransferase family protein [Bacillus sp. FJAT-42376]